MKVKLSPRWSAWLHDGLTPLKRPLLEWKAARHFAGPWGQLRIPPLRIPIVPRPSHGGGPAHVGPARVTSVVRLRKRSPRDMEIEIDSAWLAGRGGFSTAWRRLGGFVDLISDRAIPCGEWEADLGDQVSAEGPLLGFCSNFRQTLLVPDRGFHASRGYARQRREAASAPAFDDRDDTIVWRGSPTGRGSLATLAMDPGDSSLRQRVRMCILLRPDAGGPAGGTGGVDVRMLAGSYGPADLPAELRNSDLPESAAARRTLAAITGQAVPQSSWRLRKFAIDIDGHANAFSNLFIRLVYGCCVIKVASPFGYRQWYYDDLRPWEHFIPVAADLSDLLEKIDWCRRHPGECRAVASRGQALALAMTPERERRRTIEAIAAGRIEPAAVAHPLRPSQESAPPPVS